MSRLSRRGLAIPLVLVLLGVLAGFSYMIHRLRRDLDGALARALAGAHLESLALSCLEETHYQLSLAYPPAAPAAARAALAAATAAGPDAQDPEANALPAAGELAAPPRLDHDLAKFLVESDRVLAFAPFTTASTLAARSGIVIDPVEVQVVARQVGSPIASPYAGELAPSPAVRAALGLPDGLDAVQSTWGVLELRSRVRWNRPGGTITRSVVQRKLFAVVASTPVGDAPRTYAHLFDDPLAQAVSRG